MNYKQIKSQIHSYQSKKLKLFASSSFQTHSIPMLHILSRIDKSIPICFINTGFHFPETLTFRDEIAEKFELNLIDINPLTPKSMQINDQGRFHFASDPDYCCFLNKTQPLEPMIIEYDIWINGIRADQNQNRKNMKLEQKGLHDSLRFHPMLEWSSKMIYQYIKEFNLPSHPLDNKGYLSIGCEPCTRKFDLTNDRDARWFGMSKTECGLHTELVVHDQK